jgi:hypothetical protein
MPISPLQARQMNRTTILARGAECPPRSATATPRARAGREAAAVRVVGRRAEHGRQTPQSAPCPGACPPRWPGKCPPGNPRDHHSEAVRRQMPPYSLSELEAIGELHRHKGIHGIQLTLMSFASRARNRRLTRARGGTDDNSHSIHGPKNPENAAGPSSQIGAARSGIACDQTMTQTTPIQTGMVMILPVRYGFSDRRARSP